MIKEDSFVDLARDCVGACHVLRTVAEGRGTGNLSGPSEKQVEQIVDLGRCVNPARPSLLSITSGDRIVRHIESAVSERANHGRDLPEHRLGSTKEHFVMWRTEMWEILRVFDVCDFQSVVVTVSKLPQADLGQGSVLEASGIGRSNGSRPPTFAPSLFLHGNLGLIEGAAPPVLIGSGGMDRGLINKGGPSLLSRDTNNSSKPPLVPDSRQALERLISRAVPPHELISAIAAVVSSIKAADIVDCLQGSGAQTFIDIIDEACHHAILSLGNWFIDICSNPSISLGQALDNLNLPPRARRKCVKSLYKTCAGHTLLPRSLHFGLHEDPVGGPVHGGGFGDVWKCEHRGREVAVKVLRPRYNNGSRDVNNVSVQPTGFHSLAFVG